MTENDEPKLWPLEEAMSRLGGISRSTLDDAARVGLVRYTRLGRRVFLADDELRRIITHGLKTPTVAEKKAGKRRVAT